MNTRKVILYIAMSIDGYIAQEDGDISFLDAMQDGEEDYGYSDFVETVDTVLMGRKTYEKILSFGIPYPHQDKQTYVVTRQLKIDEDNVTFYNGILPSLISKLKAQEGDKNIYVDGGAELVHCLIKYNLIDEYVISVIPHFLGGGIKLFKEGRPGQHLELIGSKAFPKGLVQLHYQKNS